MTKYGNPPLLPLKKLDVSSYYRELESASYALGMLQVAHKKISNSDHLIKPLLTREAALSSKIEGTITDSKDVLVMDATGKAPKQDTVVVANYRRAMRDAITLSKRKSITHSNIRSLHKTLLSNTLHKGTLGKYREVDAWIGEDDNTPIGKALYVAPHHAQVRPYMDNLLEYFNKAEESPLIKVAIFHYQFEAIHPFEDGNGRIGRMLIPALLHYQKSISAPVLYTSEHFEKKSVEYRERLREVDRTRDITPWIIFFLESIREQCNISINLVDRILSLNAQLHEKYKTSQSPYMTQLIDFIFENPVFSIPEAIGKLGATRLTITTLVQQLGRDSILTQLDGIKAPHGAKVYFFPRLISLIA
ncbi:MAG TPA: Fic family protein [Candidatus Saccharimonadales bacterium]|nr:Fic family protein [Candidatus Saccharimonadales bacterium]